MGNRRDGSVEREAPQAYPPRQGAKRADSRAEAARGCSTLSVGKTPDALFWVKRHFVGATIARANIGKMRRRVGTALLAILASAAAVSRVGAGPSAWQPSPGRTQVPLWPGAVSGAQPVEAEESGTVVDSAGSKRLVAGRPWVYVGKVSRPTLTVYSPVGRNTGAAVVVFPGGGYNVLAIDLEGTEVCDWLTSRGITGMLLKYRVPCVKSGPYRDCRTALEDAQRAMGPLSHKQRRSRMRMQPR